MWATGGSGWLGLGSKPRYRPRSSPSRHGLDDVEAITVAQRYSMVSTARQTSTVEGKEDVIAHAAILAVEVDLEHGMSGQQRVDRSGSRLSFEADVRRSAHAVA